MAAVVARIDADPDLVRAVAKAPPKKDDGQSALQVAIKSGNLEVAQLLIDTGADVNAKDSAGNPALMRGVLDAGQVLDEPVLIELREDLHRIFDLLVRAGADKECLDPWTGDRLVDFTEGHPVRQFLPD